MTIRGNKRLFVYIVEPFKIILYNIIFYWFGATDAVAEGSSLYSAVMVGMFFVSFAQYVWWLAQKRYVNKTVFTLTLLYLGACFVSFLFNFNANYAYEKYFYFFIVFSLPSILWGIEFGQEGPDGLSWLAKWLEPISWLISVYCTLVVLLPNLSGDVELRGYAYQSHSYYAALAFGLLLFYVGYEERDQRFAFFKSKIATIVRLVLICIMPIAVISTGGKGGFVLMLVYVVMYLLLKDRKKPLLSIAYIVGGIVCLLVVVYIISNNRFLSDKLSFVTNYINFDTLSIDMTNTSNRNIVYAEALQLIEERPFLGYGIISYMPLMTTTGQYPHNYFLEVLLQGGTLYLMVVLFTLFCFFRKLLKQIKYDSNARIIAYLFIYTFIMLMFSGTYLTTSLFWFTLVSTLVVRRDTRNDI